MSFMFLSRSVAAVLAALVVFSCQALSSRALAQVDDDPEIRIQRLENQLRQLTGQNEELQYRNRQLEERLRQLQSGAQPTAPAPQPSAAAPPTQLSPGYGQPAQPAYGQPQYGQQQQAYPQQQPGYVPPQAAAPAPIAQDPPAAGAGVRRRGDAFDPTQNPAAPGAPQALGGGPLPIQPGGGQPVGRPAADPAMSANTTGGRYPQGAPVAAPGAGGLETAPPRQTPRDEYDLGIGYMQRRDYALAEQTMRNFTQKYPNDPMIGDAQYWLGESLYQRQQYRDAAEIFLAVTTKHDKSSKAADALLRLGQSLAALKEKEAACAAFGEVTRKYPRASAGVKSTVDREQKRVKC